MGVSQTELSRRLEADTRRRWRVSRISKILNGHIPFTVDDLVLMCDAAGISLVSVVRQRGREFVADLTPSELNVIELIRENPTRADHVIALLPRRGQTFRELQRASRSRVAQRMQRMEPTEPRAAADADARSKRRPVKR